MKPRVCIDLRPTQTEAKYSGTGVYAYQLVQAIESLSHNLDLYYLTLQNYTFPYLRIPNERLIKVWRPHKPERWHAIFDWITLGPQLVRHHIKLFHMLTPGLISFASQLATVVTVHDFIPLNMPQDSASSLDVKLLYQFRLKQIRGATHCISVSAATSKELVELQKIPTEKISVVYHAANQNFALCPDLLSKQYRQRLPEQYILYLGGYTYRKNVPMLLHAYKNLKQAFPELHLVLAGKVPEPKRQELIQLSRLLEIESSLVWTGVIPVEQLPSLYAGAHLFVYPSLYEGFGLPVIEAMSCGTPVVSSTAGSLAEIAGDAALLVDPTNLTEITNAIKALLTDTQLRNHFAQKGKERARLFSWEKCARETLTVYESVLKNGSNL